MNVLITGGAGFIGSNLIPYLLRQARQDLELDIRILVNYDVLTGAGNRENLADCETDPRYHFVHADVCDRDALAKALAAHEIDALIHLAAETGVERSIDHPEPFVTTNLVGTFQLLEACRLHHSSTGTDFRFIHVSCGCDCDCRDDSPPGNPYAATAAGGHHLVRAWANAYGFPAVAVTGGKAFGPFQSPDKLVPQAIRRIAAGRPVTLYGDGSQTRDWIYVEDFCRGLAAVALNGRPGEAYHLGADNQRRNIDVVRQIVAVVHALQPGCPLPKAEDLIRLAPGRPGHDRRGACDGSRAREELGWSPRETFDTGLRKTVQWYLDNEDWIETAAARRHPASRPHAAAPVPASASTPT